MLTYAFEKAPLKRIGKPIWAPTFLRMWIKRYAEYKGKYKLRTLHSGNCNCTLPKCRGDMRQSRLNPHILNKELRDIKITLIPHSMVVVQQVQPLLFNGQINKRPFLGNGSINTHTKIAELLKTVFSLGSSPRLHNEDLRPETVKYIVYCTLYIVHCKIQTRPLVREGAPYQQTRNCVKVIKIWS
jgi:hypothetical protein